MSPQPNRHGDALLRPSEVAKMFGVRTPTIARWAREGRLTPILTPGGHRRYHLADIHALFPTTETSADPAIITEPARRQEGSHSGMGSSG